MKHMHSLKSSSDHKDVETSPNMDAEDIKVGQNHQDTVAVKNKYIKIKTICLIKVLPDRVTRCCGLKDPNSFCKELTFPGKRVLSPAKKFPLTGI